METDGRTSHTSIVLPFSLVKLLDFGSFAVWRLLLFVVVQLALGLGLVGIIVEWNMKDVEF